MCTPSQYAREAVAGDASAGGSAQYVQLSVAVGLSCRGPDCLFGVGRRRRRVSRRFRAARAAERAIWRAPYVFGNLAFTNAGWSSSVARWAHNPEVAGSNPVPATSENGSRRLLRGPFSCPMGTFLGTFATLTVAWERIGNGSAQRNDARRAGHVFRAETTSQQPLRCFATSATASQVTADLQRGVPLRA